MTDREKLIALIDMAEDVAEEYCWTADSCKTCGKKTKDGDKCCTGMMADILIDNGVVVREKGEWVELTGRALCPVCADECWADSVMEYNFCPNCGADMRKEKTDGVLL